MSEWSETTSKNLEIQVSEGQLLKNYHFVQLTELTDDCIERIADAVVKKMLAAEPEIIRCRDCKWFGEIGCAIGVVDDTDKPTENDYCSFAERRSDG